MMAYVDTYIMAIDHYVVHDVVSFDRRVWSDWLADSGFCSNDSGVDNC